MVSSNLKETAEILRKQKNNKRQQWIVLCLAILVVVGTVSILMATGQAMTHKTRLLNCKLEVHEHNDDCYDEEDQLICGYADYVVHVHNDDCRDADGNLVCTLPEIEEHKHTDECYTEEKVLVCEAAETEEAEGHKHTDECYTTPVAEETVLTCEKEEHTHNEDCYSAGEGEKTLTCDLEESEEHTHGDECYTTSEGEETLTCTLEEHTHGEECYSQGETAGEPVLTCGLEESETVSGHTHTDECYVEERILSCGKLELHTHSEENGCFEKKTVINEDGEEEEIDVLNCEIPELVEHIHGEDCFETVELSEEEIANMNKAPVQKVYEGDNYRVTATYTADAGIPEDAELIVEPIDSDSEHYAQREEEYRASLEDENASMQALMRIGFYATDENGETQEIEPTDAVTITVQFLDENGLTEGRPITVVHFADDGAEVLDGGKAEDNSTTFKTDKFSEFAFGYATSQEGAIYVSETFEYEDDAFHMTFHVEGEAVPVEGEVLPPTESAGAQPDVQQPTEGEGGEAVEPTEPKEEGEAGEPGDQGEDAAPTEPSAQGEETTSAGPQEATDPTENSGENPDASAPEGGEGSGDAVPGDEGNSDDQMPGGDGEGTATEGGEDAGMPEGEGTEPAESASLEFKVEPLAEATKEYAALTAYAEEISTGGDQLMLRPMTCNLTYEGVPMDLAACEIKVEIRPTEELNRYAEGDAAALPEIARPNADDGEMGKKEVQVTAIQMQDETQAMEADSMLLNGAGGSSEEPVVAFTMPAGKSKAFAMRMDDAPNPPFMVQYYANLEVVKTEDGTNALPVIDTSGGAKPSNDIAGGNAKLPINKKGTETPPNENPIKNIYVDDNGNVETDEELTEIYQSRSYEYFKAPTIKYINALIENPHYDLEEVWVLKHKHGDGCYASGKKGEGDLTCKEGESTDKGDWKIYGGEDLDALHFTSRDPGILEKDPSDKYEQILDDDVIRLVYKVSDATPDIEAAFYDYDISSGSIYDDVYSASYSSSYNNYATSKQTDNKVWYAYTKASGINHETNYSGNEGVKLAFGNVNTGTTFGENIWDGNLLNKFNGTQSGHPAVAGSYKGCTFGLVTGLADGKLQYASGVDAPKLFNDGTAQGKAHYDENQYSLKFNRSGDTYTLTAVNGTGTSGLEKFENPSPYEGKVHTSIWTNNFWPMDSAPSFGTDGHDIKFGKYSVRGNRAFAGNRDTESSELGSIKGGSKKAFPYADDGQDHNSYFGMYYQVKFDLYADYVGPLEYYFFGDDDMWVFLDDQLVCDIGGVHSSVGEYVNLWDYLKEDHKRMQEEQKAAEAAGNKAEPVKTEYVLSFFYTERGASGSTCWMQFTLPEVSSLTPETVDDDHGNLKVLKTVTKENPATKAEEAYDNGDEFTFTIKLTNAQGGNLKDDYPYTKYDKEGNETDDSGLIVRPIGNGVVSNGTTFTLKNGEWIEIRYLPVGTKYTITEADDAHMEDGDSVKNSNYVYDTVIDGGTTTGPKTVTGEITKGDTVEITYNNKFRAYRLPKTGGMGTAPYTSAGVLLLILAAAFCVYSLRRKSMEK